MQENNLDDDIFEFVEENESLDQHEPQNLKKEVFPFYNESSNNKIEKNNEVINHADDIQEIKHEDEFELNEVDEDEAHNNINNNSLDINNKEIIVGKANQQFEFTNINVNNERKEENNNKEKVITNSKEADKLNELILIFDQNTSNEEINKEIKVKNDTLEIKENDEFKKYDLIDSIGIKEGDCICKEKEIDINAEINTNAKEKEEIEKEESCKFEETNENKFTFKEVANLDEKIDLIENVKNNCKDANTDNLEFIGAIENHVIEKKISYRDEAIKSNNLIKNGENKEFIEALLNNQEDTKNNIEIKTELLTGSQNPITNNLFKFNGTTSNKEKETNKLENRNEEVFEFPEVEEQTKEIKKETAKDDDEENFEFNEVEEKDQIKENYHKKSQLESLRDQVFEFKEENEELKESIQHNDEYFEFNEVDEEVNENKLQTNHLLNQNDDVFEFNDLEEEKPEYNALSNPIKNEALTITQNKIDNNSDDDDFAFVDEDEEIKQQPLQLEKNNNNQNNEDEFDFVEEQDNTNIYKEINYRNTKQEPFIQGKNSAKIQEMIQKHKEAYLKNFFNEEVKIKQHFPQSITNFYLDIDIQNSNLEKIIKNINVLKPNLEVGIKSLTVDELSKLRNLNENTIINKLNNKALAIYNDLPKSEIKKLYFKYNELKNTYLNSSCAVNLQHTNNLKKETTETVDKVVEEIEVIKSIKTNEIEEFEEIEEEKNKITIDQALYSIVIDEKNTNIITESEVKPIEVEVEKEPVYDEVKMIEMLKIMTQNKQSESIKIEKTEEEISNEEFTKIIELLPSYNFLLSKFVEYPDSIFNI